MARRHPPIHPQAAHFLHGGDYNPDQWPPEVWDEDIRLMREAGCNAMSVGIFAWRRLEPEEGRYDFAWLDTVLDKLAAAGIHAVLATPSAAHPDWLAARYPEVQRVDEKGERQPHRGRVNFCLTSPVYREKAAAIARRLAERYAGHPALIAWHVHNEYVGACYCELCQAAFRDWLREKYESLEALNQAYWAYFWSQAYSSWENIHPRNGVLQGLQLDWRRFTTDQCIACYRNEADVLREAAPGVPVTTNTFQYFVNYDPRRWAPHLDVVAWDNYPWYHARDEDWRKAVEFSFQADFWRALKRKPFMLMETTPSSTNWMPVAKLKRPGIHRLTALQAVAHGSETVQYFQWRAGRGGGEKFHGAVITHSGHSNTRVFREVADVGACLAKLDDVLGTDVEAEVALIHDKEVEWGIELAAGPRGEKRDYRPTAVAHYQPFWQRGIPVDVVHMDADLSGYRLVAAPMLYLLRPGVAERLQAFVEGGGTLVTTYWSGIVDENDRCFQGGFPGPLAELTGVWAEELDVLYDDESVPVAPVAENPLGLAGTYQARIFCDLLHAESAQVLATYAGEFYAGRPALTVKRWGEGEAYYVGFRGAEPFLDDFYGALARRAGLRPVVEAELPCGVTAQRRSDGDRHFVFLMNFRNQQEMVHLKSARYRDLVDGGVVGERHLLPPHTALVLEELP